MTLGADCRPPNGADQVDTTSARLQLVTHPSETSVSVVHDERLRQLRQLTLWLDRRYLDPIVGLLLPGAGDLIGAALGLFGIGVAFRLRAHPLVIARMLLNLAFDAMLGALPFVGDAADFLYRAHQRNLQLLEQRRERKASASDWLVVGLSALAFAVALCLPLVLVVGIVRGVQTHWSGLR